MDLAISNIAWDESNDEIVYREMKKLGYTALEIAPTRFIDRNPYSLRNIEVALQIKEDIKNKYGFSFCSMQSILYKVSDRLFYGVDERNALLEKLKQTISYANRMNCNNIVFGCPQNRNIVDYKLQYKTGVEFFQQVSEFAQKSGVKFSIEANPPIYNTNFINTTEQAIQLIHDVNIKSFGLNLDLGTVIYNQESLTQIADNMNLVNHIHISEPFLEPIQSREIHKELFEILRKFKYEFAVSIEMKNNKNINQLFEIMKYISCLKNDK